jgi:RNA polymerase sigma-70 factor (ECF subfamily)
VKELEEFSVPNRIASKSRLMPDEESALIQRARQGDAVACAALYDRHYDVVYRYCYYHVGDTARAQDVASEVFVRMVENLDTFDMRGRPLLAWLYAIARNLVADTFRRREQTTLPLDDVLVAGEDTPMHRAERRLLADRLAAALAYLTEEQRQVILFKFVLDHSNAEVARLMEKSEGAIKSLQHRALAALRRALEEEQSHET